MGEDREIPVWIANNKTRLMQVLRSLGATSVQIHYDGSGDDGCVQSVDVIGADDTVVCDTQVEIYRHRYLMPPQPETTGLPEALEFFAYDLLQEHFGGWENNDGAFGTLDFDLCSGKVAWTHNTRYTEVDTHEQTL